MTLQEFYVKSGGSYENAMYCFKTEDRIRKYLNVFNKDENFKNLEKTLMAKDFKQAFICAHTLKGMAKTLSLDKLGQSSSALTEMLRNYSGQDYEILLRYVRDDYHIAIALMKDIEYNLEK